MLAFIVLPHGLWPIARQGRTRHSRPFNAPWKWNTSSRAAGAGGCPGGGGGPAGGALRGGAAATAGGPGGWQPAPLPPVSGGRGG